MFAKQAKAAAPPQPEQVVAKNVHASEAVDEISGSRFGLVGGGQSLL